MNQAEYLLFWRERLFKHLNKKKRKLAKRKARVNFFADQLNKKED